MKEPPESYTLGDSLDWAAEWREVLLVVELPFWLMVPDTQVSLSQDEHDFTLEIKSNMAEFHATEFRDSKASCAQLGEIPFRPAKELLEIIERDSVPHLIRKCKTVLTIPSRCNADVLAAVSEEPPQRSTEAQHYLRALCKAHLGIVNQVVRGYRVATYDYFAYEVHPWDLPTWFIIHESMMLRVSLFDYANWDFKPHLIRGDSEQEYVLIEPDDLQPVLGAPHTAGEMELLDALNFMQRGDYSGAVRRIATALEAVTEAVLANELRKRYSEPEVARKLDASRNDYPGRIRQYEKLSGRTLSEQLRREIETTRQLRHDIVHRAYRISYSDRGRAQRAVDTGRWAYNWLEDVPERRATRERNTALRSLGCDWTLFDAEITKDGVVVYKCGGPPVAR